MYPWPRTVITTITLYFSTPDGATAYLRRHLKPGVCFAESAIRDRNQHPVDQSNLSQSTRWRGEIGTSEAMRNIYERVEHVGVWLAGSEANSDEAMEFMEHLNEAWDNIARNSPRGNDSFEGFWTQWSSTGERLYTVLNTSGVNGSRPPAAVHTVRDKAHVLLGMVKNGEDFGIVPSYQPSGYSLSRPDEGIYYVQPKPKFADVFQFQATSLNFPAWLPSLLKDRNTGQNH